MGKKESDRERRGKLGRAEGWEGGEGGREREREREGRRVDEYKSDKMSHPVLTECVEILDGHTTNKRDPSDSIQLRSAGGGLAGRRSITLRQQWNDARTLRRTNGTISRNQARWPCTQAGSKSCICHGAMGGVARAPPRS